MVHIAEPKTERLREFFDYNPETGEFRWRKVPRMANRVVVGELAGGIDERGYWRVCFSGRKWRVHRLIFSWLGETVPEQVDHINGKRSDNRWKNLRAADALSNAKNAKKRYDGGTIITGVGFNKRLRQWYARVNHRGDYYHLGMFACLGQAIKARKAANKRYGYHQNHGRSL